MAKNPHLDFDEEPSGTFAEQRAIAEKLEMDAYWRRLADSLTEHARKQLLDDLRGWNEATREHRLHPTRPTDTTSEAAHPGKGDRENGV